MLAVVKKSAEIGISLEDVPIPEFSPWEVLLKVKAVGICGSDLRMYKYADPNRRGNYILGHELSGEVVDTGRQVNAESILLVHWLRDLPLLPHRARQFVRKSQ